MNLQTSLRRLALVLSGVILLSCAAGKSADVDRLIGDLHAAPWQVRASAAEALGRQGGGRAIAPLREALADDSPEVRSSAVRSLGRLGAREALDDVRARIQKDKDREVLVQAAFALASLAQGDDRGVEVARSPAPAEHEQQGVAVSDAERGPTRSPVRLENGLPDRIAGDDRPTGVREALRRALVREADGTRPARQDAIGDSWHRVLLVQHQWDTRDHRAERERDRNVPAEAGHDVSLLGSDDPYAAHQ